ncbi:Asp-tRNA(Asn)/Glu-tRNA(Gln) amidotransferase subunit GatC [Caedibacter taeniospiralis]|uniref:Asp-tRNA(Asn)/Glu-tRNA(Gln) amidotransferase subunit GatC n=1 Tax=Caedibacter taeniospiralis TaxID=28907 RepID=UPI0037C0513B
MVISRQELEHILALSKLSANQQELERFEEDLNRILTLFSNIQSVDTEDVKPMISPLTNHGIMRDDTPCSQQHEHEFQAIAPEYQAHYFIVPKVIE